MTVTVENKWKTNLNSNEVLDGKTEMLGNQVGSFTVLNDASQKYL